LAFNAQGSRGIIVAVHVGAMEAFRKKEREGETQKSIKFPPSPPQTFFAGFLIKFHPLYDQTQGSGAVFSLLYGYLNSNK
jgi:hypothetical protein